MMIKTTKMHVRYITKKKNNRVTRLFCGTGPNCGLPSRKPGSLRLY